MISLNLKHFINFTFQETDWNIFLMVRTPSFFILHYFSYLYLVLTDLPCLSHLDVSDNHITSITHNIYKMKALTNLNIGNNSLARWYANTVIATRPFGSTGYITSVFVVVVHCFSRFVESTLPVHPQCSFQSDRDHIKWSCSLPVSVQTNTGLQWPAISSDANH